MSNVRRSLEQALNEAVRPEVVQPAAQNESNVVIFEMMMHYKRKYEDEEAINAIAFKKLKTQQDRIVTLTEWADELLADNHQLGQMNAQLQDANINGRTEMRRQRTGTDQLAASMGELLQTVNIVLITEDMGGIDGGGEWRGGDFLRMEANDARRKALAAIDLINGVSPEIAFGTNADDLRAIEMIDLTGEETEEED